MSDLSAKAAIVGIQREGQKRIRADAMKQQATKELRKYCLAAQKAGVSITEIAAQAGLSRQGVYDLLGEPPSS